MINGNCIFMSYNTHFGRKNMKTSHNDLIIFALFCAFKVVGGMLACMAFPCV